MSIWHILPVNDIKKHIEDSTCDCLPEVKIVEESGDMMVVHNAWDVRE